MGRKKKVFHRVLVHGIADKGMAVGKSEEGEVVFIKGAVPGDLLDVQGLRKKKGVWQGVPKNFISKSLDRVEARCAHFEDCGGCKWQNLSYSAQLTHKQKVVEDVIRRIGGLDLAVDEIVGCERPFNYRNKMEYSFSKHRWITQAEIDSGEDVQSDNALGFHSPGSYWKIVHVDQCHLQAFSGDKIRNGIYELAIEKGWSFYDPKAQEGWLRALLLRNNMKGEFMACLIIKEDSPEAIEQVSTYFKEYHPEITSFYIMINNKVNDALHDLEPQLIFGNPKLEISIGKVKYEIGPKSFFQTNTQQAEVLFDKIVEFAAFDGSENVYDLYCGSGSIGMYIHPYVDRVTGIEVIPEAIDDAHLNAAKNKLNNMQFHVGDVKDLLNPAFVEKHGIADVIITDPPRAGMHQDVVSTLLKLKAPKLVYVSCNPATQARDLKLLSEAYQVEKLQPVDMFPHTHHVESIALLKLE